MKTIFAIGFETPTFKKTMFYCFDKQIGAYLSNNIDNAYEFMSIESAKRDAPQIMKYFYAYPTNYTIYKGTKE